MMRILLCMMIWSMGMLAWRCNTHKYPQGKRLYAAYCENCHMRDGSGLAELYPPLTNSDYFQSHLAQVPCIIRHGMDDPISVNGTAYHAPMQGFPQMTAVEITNIINYIYYEFYKEPVVVKLTDVEAQLLRCE